MEYDGRPWLKSYDPDVPENIEIPHISLKHNYLETFNQHSGDQGIDTYMLDVARMMMAREE